MVQDMIKFQNNIFMEHTRKLTRQWKKNNNEDVFPIAHGDFVLPMGM